MNFLSSLLLFDYGNDASVGGHWSFVIPYLVGSLFFLNASVITTIFLNSVSGKVAYPQEIEPLQATMGMLALVARGLGAVVGGYLSITAMASVYLVLSGVIVAGVLIFFQYLKPSAS